MSLTSETSPTVDVAEWFRLWMQVYEFCNSFSEHHEFLKATGVLILSGCEELINSNFRQESV